MRTAPATAVQLARVEGTRLLRNPVVWLAAALAGVMARADRANELHFVLVGYAVLPAGLVLLIASAFAVRRDRSSGTTELMSTTPTDEPTRTVGFGLAGIAGGGLTLAVTAVVWLFRARDATLGPAEETIPQDVMVPRPNLAQFLQGPFCVVMLCALGVLLGRLLPSWLVVVALIIPAMVQFLFLGLWNGVGTSAGNWWFPLSSGWVTGEWIGCTNESVLCILPVRGFDRTTPWWHLPYLVALAALFLTLAMCRDRRDRSTVVAGIVAAGAVVGFAAVQAAVYTPFTWLGG